MDFLVACPQEVRVGNNTSATLTLNTGAPQGCMLRPLVFSLFTHNCVAMHNSNTIITFADKTTVVGLITDDNETAYRKIREVSVWCHDINLSLPFPQQAIGMDQGLQETEG
jgi:hypothetical protein